MIFLLGGSADDMQTRAVIQTFTCIQWRPSYRLAQVIAILVGLALLSIALSGLTPQVQYVAMIGLLGGGCMRVGRFLSQCHRLLRIPWNRTLPVSVDGEQVRDFTLQWRGSIALLSWTRANGHQERVQCWPDTVSIAHRRALSLAMHVRQATAHSSLHRAPWCFLSI